MAWSKYLQFIDLQLLMGNHYIFHYFSYSIAMCFLDDVFKILY